MQNEAEVLLVLFLSFPVTCSQQNILKRVGKVQRVANLRDILLTMPNFQNLVRGEIMYQNHRNNENLEEVRVKDVNHPPLAPVLKYVSSYRFNCHKENCQTDRSVRFQQFKPP